MCQLYWKQQQRESGGPMYRDTYGDERMVTTKRNKAQLGSMSSVGLQECYICHREFGSHSIGNHEVQCLARWTAENNRLPLRLRLPIPLPTSTIVKRRKATSPSGKLQPLSSSSNERRGCGSTDSGVSPDVDDDEDDEELGNLVWRCADLTSTSRHQPQRPGTATLDRPTVLDTETLGAIDMSKMNKNTLAEIYENNSPRVESRTNNRTLWRSLQPSLEMMLMEEELAPERAVSISANSADNKLGLVTDNRRRRNRQKTRMMNGDNSFTSSSAIIQGPFTGSVQRLTSQTNRKDFARQDPPDSSFFLRDLGSVDLPAPCVSCNNRNNAQQERFHSHASSSNGSNGGRSNGFHNPSRREADAFNNALVSGGGGSMLSGMIGGAAASSIRNPSGRAGRSSDSRATSSSRPTTRRSMHEKSAKSNHKPGANKSYFFSTELYKRNGKKQQASPHPVPLSPRATVRKISTTTVTKARALQNNTTDEANTSKVVMPEIEPSYLLPKVLRSSDFKRLTDKQRTRELHSVYVIIDDGRGAIPGKPKTLVCYVCNREFGTTSLAIHEPKCIERFNQENTRLPANRRRVLPERPPCPITISEWNEFANQTQQTFLSPCPNCGRRFAPDRLDVHLRGCHSATTTTTESTSSRPSVATKPAGRPPLNNTCYICKREFSKRSLRIHEAQCLKAWKIENDKLPVHLRKREPVKPDDFPVVWTPSGGVNYQGTMDAIWQEHLDNLIRCRKCGRSFFPDRIESHERKCNADPRANYSRQTGNRD